MLLAAGIIKRETKNNRQKEKVFHRAESYLIENNKCLCKLMKSVHNLDAGQAMNVGERKDDKDAKMNYYP